ncbi:MAG TPA: hypothetical protein VH475_07655 [Tepidisphaeraceae bacterium]|jgi:hypothetical protein
MSTVPIIDAPQAPDWDAIPHEVTCPLCGYNLRGLADPRCPECGHRFNWPEVTDPEKRLHPYLFEHHPERNVWSFTRTLVGTLRPGEFWGGLPPSQPSRPSRLRGYWLLTFLIATLPFFAEWARATITGWNRPSTLVFGPQGWPYSEHSWSQLFMAARNAWSGDPILSMTFSQLLLWIVWPWLTLLTLQIFRISMRRAKVRTVHVLRCVIYSFDFGAWFGLLGYCWAIFAILTDDQRFGTRRWPETELTIRAVGFFGIATILVLWRMGTAYRRYMRFDHAFATIVSSQIIVFLLVLNYFAIR